MAHLDKTIRHKASTMLVLTLSAVKNNLKSSSFTDRNIHDEIFTTATQNLKTRQ
jgi:hypothetical protein